MQAYVFLSSTVVLFVASLAELNMWVIYIESCTLKYYETEYFLENISISLSILMWLYFAAEVFVQNKNSSFTMYCTKPLLYIFYSLPPINYVNISNVKINMCFCFSASLCTCILIIIIFQIQIQIILLHYNVIHRQTEFDPSYGNPQ